MSEGVTGEAVVLDVPCARFPSRMLAIMLDMAVQIVLIVALFVVIGATGSEKNEVLFLLDEASALGSLSAIEEALVRGRSAGVRLLLA